jgi:hypothetical protein
MNKVLKIAGGILAAIAVAAFAAVASHPAVGRQEPIPVAASSDAPAAGAAVAAAEDADAAATAAMNATAVDERQHLASNPPQSEPEQTIDGVTITRDQAIAADEVSKAGGVANCDWECQDAIHRREGN